MQEQGERNSRRGSPQKPEQNLRNVAHVGPSERKWTMMENGQENKTHKELWKGINVTELGATAAIVQAGSRGMAAGNGAPWHLWNGVHLAVLAHKVWHVTDLTYYRFHSLIFILNICEELSRKSFILTKFKTKVLFHRPWETERKAVSLWHHTAKIFAISRWTEVCSSHYNRPVSSNVHQE